MKYYFITWWTIFSECWCNDLLSCVPFTYQNSFIFSGTDTLSEQQFVIESKWNCTVCHSLLLSHSPMHRNVCVIDSLNDRIMKLKCISHWLLKALLMSTASSRSNKLLTISKDPRSVSLAVLQMSCSHHNFHPTLYQILWKMFSFLFLLDIPARVKLVQLGWAGISSLFISYTFFFLFEKSPCLGFFFFQFFLNTWVLAPF